LPAARGRPPERGRLAASARPGLEQELDLDRHASGEPLRGPQPDRGRRAGRQHDREEREALVEQGWIETLRRRGRDERGQDHAAVSRERADGRAGRGQCVLGGEAERCVRVPDRHRPADPAHVRQPTPALGIVPGDEEPPGRAEGLDVLITRRRGRGIGERVSRRAVPSGAIAARGVPLAPLGGGPAPRAPPGAGGDAAARGAVRTLRGAVRDLQDHLDLDGDAEGE
jgi:hypothetical protein